MFIEDAQELIIEIPHVKILPTLDPHETVIQYLCLQDRNIDLCPDTVGPTVGP